MDGTPGDFLTARGNNAIAKYSSLCVSLLHFCFRFRLVYYKLLKVPKWDKVFPIAYRSMLKSFLPLTLFFLKQNKHKRGRRGGISGANKTSGKRLAKPTINVTCEINKKKYLSFPSFFFVMSNYECSLQGIIIGQEQKDRLIQRLVGICGNDSMVDLFEHEIIFTPSSKTPFISFFYHPFHTLFFVAQTPMGPARNDDVVLRVQSKITTEKEKSFRFRQW